MAHAAGPARTSALRNPAGLSIRGGGQSEAAAAHVSRSSSGSFHLPATEQKQDWRRGFSAHCSNSCSSVPLAATEQKKDSRRGFAWGSAVWCSHGAVPMASALAVPQHRGARGRICTESLCLHCSG